jgi:hypothetical protein
LIDGGSTFSVERHRDLMKLAAPAADLRWPIIDFTDPIRIGPRAPRRPSPITSVSASTSTLSADDRARAVAFEEVDVDGIDSRFGVGASQRELLSSMLGAVIPLPLPSEDPPMPRMTA